MWNTTGGSFGFLIRICLSMLRTIAVKMKPVVPSSTNCHNGRLAVRLCRGCATIDIRPIAAFVSGQVSLSPFFLHAQKGENLEQINGPLR